MTTLSVSLFGPFQASIAKRPLPPFRTRKVKALFIYLVVENGKTLGVTHQREALMDLLWSELPLKSARANLRHVLHHLRKGIPDATIANGEKPIPFLLTDRKQVGIHPDYPIELDVTRFTQLVLEGSFDQREEAATLIRGDFLSDFYLTNSETFETWATNRRAMLQLQVLDLLDKLAEHYLKERQYEKAQQVVWQQLALDDLQERAYQQLMTALAKTGQRNAAIAQYQLCCQRLEDELGVKPTAKTTDLYQQIQADVIKETQLQQPPPTLSQLPPDAWLIFLFSDIEGSTRLWDTHRDKMLPVLKRHCDILQLMITQHGGRILELRGDGTLAVFAGVNPLACVLAIQQQFAQENWGEVDELRIRIGMHGVSASCRNHDYFYDDGVYYGPVLNHASRIADTGHGGQIVASTAVKDNFDLPPNAYWQDLGQHKLKSLDKPQHIFGLLHPDLPLQTFPPLRIPAAKNKQSTTPTNNRFIQENLIAVGGHGKLYRGQDRETGKQVVIKRLRPELLTQRPELMERFIREGEALSQLNHPNIVKMIAAQEQDGEPIIVMEYVSGGDLRELMDREGPLRIARILEIALELADALTRTHHLGIIHRDLKPSNVLLAEDGTPRLTDFGIASMKGKDLRLTQGSSMLGSPAYMSPEACQGETLDMRSDIWSFGILLYEMLIGQLPFPGKNIMTVHMSILNDPLPDLNEFQANNPSQLLSLIQNMLVKEPDKRISSVRQVAATLEHIQTALRTNEKIRGENDTDPYLSTSSAFIFRKQPAHKQALFFSYNLPTQPTAFIGRAGELATLDRLLSDANTRLITIVGPGGMGKTRLALAMGQQQLTRQQDSGQPRFPRGIFFVPLAPLRDSDAIVSTIANALQLPLQEGQRSAKQQVLDFLKEKQLLLILDNFEHLLEGVGLITEILETAPDVKIVVTSRERLQLRAEHLFAIEGLELPDWEAVEDALEYTAVQLFLQSARRNQPDFELTEEDDLASVINICHLVAGMPLALELAAAWVDMLSLQDIVTEIRQSLDLLQTELHDVPARHRSLRVTIDNSWRRLTQKERHIFAKLAIFRGGFTRRAGQQIAEASLQHLTRLANKSFLSYNRRRDRYQIHELMRQYSVEKLAQHPQNETKVRDAHCQYYLHAFAAQEKDLKGKRQKEALDKIEADFENVKVAWSWAVQQEHNSLLNQSLLVLDLFCSRRGYMQEEKTLTQEIKLKLQTGVHTGERGLLWARIMYWWVSSTEELILQLQKSEQLLSQLAEEGVDVRLAKATILLILANHTKNKSKVKESLALYKQLGEDWFIAKGLMLFGRQEIDSGQYEQGEQFLLQSLALNRTLDNRYGIGDALFILSFSAFYQNQLDKAAQYNQESLTFFDTRDSLKANVMSALSLWQIFSYHSFEEAERRMQRSLEMSKDMGNPYNISFTMSHYAIHKLYCGQYQRAKKFAEEALIVARDFPADDLVALNLRTLVQIALILNENAVAESQIQEAMHIYRRLGYKAHLNGSLHDYSWLQIAQQQYHQAEATIYEILAHYNIYTCFALLPTAYLLAHRATTVAEMEHVLQLIGLYEQVVPLSQSPHFQTIAQRYLPTNLANLPAEQVEAAKAKGRSLGAKEVIAELYETLPQMGWHTKPPTE